MSHARWRWLGASLAGLGLASLLGACLPDDSLRTCTLKGCLGSGVTLALVDEQGGMAAARGEINLQESPSPFDCTAAPDANSNDRDCEEGVIQLGPPNDPNSTLELRFQLPDGSFEEWQAVPLTVQRRVLKDFNGPGCDCVVFEGTAMPVVVPEAARLP
ncbi:MAG TPA: hypothetical protein VIW29_21355 [Polyangiaceae bacterium]